MSARAEAVARATTRRGHLARWCRALVRRRLAALAGGRLEVDDPLGAWAVGAGPAARMRVHDLGFYPAIVTGGSLAAARTYMDGAWSADDLPGLIRILARDPGTADRMESGLARVGDLVARVRHRLRRNTRRGSARNIHRHYDLGNDFFALFLDPTMTYSAGIFADEPTTLEQASVAKLDRLCRKLALGPHDHVLEIGTGWGSFAMHAASRYGCRVTTTTISREQHALAARRIAGAGLEDRVRLLLRDYRDLDGIYDKVVSIEMIEAVGHENLPEFFRTCARLVQPTGALALQAITMPDRRYARYLRTSDFIRDVVFPGSCVPSLGSMLDAMTGHTDLKPVHFEDLAPHYARTLRLWRQRFLRRTDQVLDLGYPEELVRLWDYYLAYCEAGFEERYLGSVQLVAHMPGSRLPVAPTPWPEAG